MGLRDDEGAVYPKEQIVKDILAAVSENKVLESGAIEKVTLALGGGEL